MAGIQRKYFLCIILFASGSIMAAASITETGESQKTSPATVLQKGTRFFPGDPKKNEFFILNEDEPNPAIWPAYVNAVPLSAGIDEDDALNAKPEEILADNTPFFREEPQANTNEQSQHDNVSGQFRKMEAMEQEEVVKIENNFSRVKTFVRKLTQKIAEKKASKSGRVSGRQLAMQEMHKEKASKADYQRKLKHIAAERKYTISKDKTGLTIIRIKLSA